MACDLRTKNYFIFGMIFFALGGVALHSSASEKSVLTELDSFSMECIQTSKLSPCKSALSLAELLQRKAASDGHYSCQSRLLGLGADLLMSSLKSS